MKKLWPARVLCLLAVLSIVFVCGCNAFTAERQRRRAYTVRTDLDRMVDDADWLLGLYRPVHSYDETMR